MKTIIYAIFFAIATAVSATSVQQQENSVPLSVGFDDPTNDELPFPKYPINIPVVTLDDHDLAFQSNHDAYTLYIIEDGEVVYSAFVPNSTTCLSLPQWLDATYEIQLHTNYSYYFFGFISFL